MFKIKWLVVLCVLTFCSGMLFAQNAISEPSQSTTAQYRLFRTTNIWTFIKLDTVTGKMWQLQFDIEGDARGSVDLNTRDLSDGKPRTSGRFTLYPTTNM